MNSDDLSRLYLARAFIKEEKIVNSFAKKGLKYSRAKLLEKLGDIGLFPLIYKDNLVFPRINLEILTLELEEIVKIGKMVKSYIQRFGPYASYSQIYQVFKENRTENYFKIFLNQKYHFDHIFVNIVNCGK